MALILLLLMVLILVLQQLVVLVLLHLLVLVQDSCGLGRDVGEELQSFSLVLS